MVSSFRSRIVPVVLVLAACERGSTPSVGETASSQSAAPTAAAAAPTTPTAPTAPTAPEAAPKSAAARRPTGQGRAELELTGALTEKLEGPIVTCGFTRHQGRDQGGTWAVNTEAFDLRVIATTDEELAAPAVVLNVRQPARKSYVFKRKAGRVTAASNRTVASLDADLHEVVGASTVHVKGTLTCPAK